MVVRFYQPPSFKRRINTVRFIDLRGQCTGHNFAWFDTVRDIFQIFGGEQAFNAHGMILKKSIY